MQLSDATHDYACTRCGATGGICMEALWLVRRISGGLSIRTMDMPPDVELTWQTSFTGCGRDCAVTLRITAATVEVASGDHGATIAAGLRPLDAARAGRG